MMTPMSLSVAVKLVSVKASGPPLLASNKNAAPFAAPVNVSPVKLRTPCVFTRAKPLSPGLLTVFWLKLNTASGSITSVILIPFPVTESMLLFVKLNNPPVPAMALDPLNNAIPSPMPSVLTTGPTFVSVLLVKLNVFSELKVSSRIPDSPISSNMLSENVRVFPRDVTLLTRTPSRPMWSKLLLATVKLPFNPLICTPSTSRLMRSLFSIRVFPVTLVPAIPLLAGGTPVPSRTKPRTVLSSASVTMSPPGLVKIGRAPSMSLLNTWSEPSLRASVWVTPSPNSCWPS